MWSSWSVLHAEIQVEPVGQLDLETHTDGIIPLFAGNVQDKSTEKTGQKKESEPGKHIEVQAGVVDINES